MTALLVTSMLSMAWAVAVFCKTGHAGFSIACLIVGNVAGCGALVLARR